MSNEQPRPGPGEEPDKQDPLHQEPPPDVGGAPGGTPPPSPPPPPTEAGGGVPGGAVPHDNAPPPPPPPPDPYGPNPYGGANGAVDPLAGMPPLASRGRRLLARIIDALIVGLPVMAVLWPLLGGYGDTRDGRSYLQQAIVLIVYFVYEGAMLSARGQTLGKMALKIRVAMLDDGAVPRGNPAWFRSATYSLAQLVPCVGFLFWLLNVLFCTWDKPYRQCIHDKAAKTVVVSD